jgi:Spy/CpxP family protein refolding chaperone
MKKCDSPFFGGSDVKTVIFVAALLALSACAQTGTHHSAVPYAGQQSRDIKALSDDEIRGYLTGAGMGFAKSAELNRYPGPMHALEMADALELTATQRAALESLLQRHKEEVRALGAEVVKQERELDRLFAMRIATSAAVDARLILLAQAQAQVRASHLKTHIEATALLDSAQIERYSALRGY